MNIEREVRTALARLDDFRPVSQIWNETPVHDIDVNPVRARRFAHGELLPEFRKVSAQDRGRNLDLAHARHASRFATNFAAEYAGTAPRNTAAKATAKAFFGCPPGNKLP
jgi:hypothetical protein